MLRSPHPPGDVADPRGAGEQQHITSNQPNRNANETHNHSNETDNNSSSNNDE